MSPDRSSGRSDERPGPPHEQGHPTVHFAGRVDRATSAPDSTTTSTRCWASTSSTRRSPRPISSPRSAGCVRSGSAAARCRCRSRRTSWSLVDDIEPSAQSLRSVNTIVNDDGRLIASNTDYLAVQQLIDEHGLTPQQSVLIRGSGGMASAVGAAFADRGFGAGVVVARNPAAGSALARSARLRIRPRGRCALCRHRRQRHPDRNGRWARGTRRRLRRRDDRAGRTPCSTWSPYHPRLR